MSQAIFVHGHVSLMSQQEKKTSVVTLERRGTSQHSKKKIG